MQLLLIYVTLSDYANKGLCVCARSLLSTEATCDTESCFTKQGSLSPILQTLYDPQIRTISVLGLSYTHHCEHFSAAQKCLYILSVHIFLMFKNVLRVKMSSVYNI
uniref:Uncharacterized protein n=1 Tax=Sphaerodactylus townsendi TaxID=933632 RepID=A0ACB8GDN5_9SAUR